MADMRMALIAGLVCAMWQPGAAFAEPAILTVDRLVEICEAPAMQAATQRGDALGWPRMTDAETAEWRKSFVACNGGSVEVAGWKRKVAGGAESPSVRVSTGPNAHKACAFSTTLAEGWLEALTNRLGAPDNSERHDAAALKSARWRRGAVEYAFTQTGSIAAVTIGPGRSRKARSPAGGRLTHRQVHAATRSA